MSFERQFWGKGKSQDTGNRRFEQPTEQDDQNGPKVGLLSCRFNEKLSKEF